MRRPSVDVAPHYHQRSQGLERCEDPEVADIPRVQDRVGRFRLELSEQVLMRVAVGIRDDGDAGIACRELQMGSYDSHLRFAHATITSGYG